MMWFRRPLFGNCLLGSRLASRPQQLQLRCFSVPSPRVSAKSRPSNLKGKSVTAQNWLNRHLNDPYVKAAQRAQYRARSAFKLIDIDDRHGIIKPGDVVVDCGAAPGSWTQVAVERTCSEGGKPPGLVVGVDILSLRELKGAVMVGNADFTQEATRQRVLEVLQGRKVNLVMSDMAPNASGVKSVDHEVIIRLCLSAWQFACHVLKPGGTFLCKYWEGPDSQLLRKRLMGCFQSVKHIKPEASRKESSELYVLARGFYKTGTTKGEST